jgi:hypothetical protein
MNKISKAERGLVGIDTLMAKAMDAADDIKAPTKDQRITGISKKVACALIAAAAIRVRR